MELDELMEKVSSSTKEEISHKPKFTQIIEKASKTTPVEKWGLNDFLHYYSKLYERVGGNVYSITFTSDSFNMKKLRAKFIKHSMDTSKISFKKFLDWCCENKQIIIANDGNFFINTLVKYINNYLVETNNNVRIEYDELFLQKLKLKVNKSRKFIDLLKIYGIPIISTYMIKIANWDEEKLNTALTKVLSDALENEKIDDLKKIAKQSINLSPYPKEFHACDWRDIFLYLWMDTDIIDEEWWRMTDYRGDVPLHYSDILK